MRSSPIPAVSSGPTHSTPPPLCSVTTAKHPIYHSKVELLSFKVPLHVDLQCVIHFSTVKCSWQKLYKPDFELSVLSGVLFDYVPSINKVFIINVKFIVLLSCYIRFKLYHRVIGCNTVLKYRHICIKMFTYTLILSTNAA